MEPSHTSGYRSLPNLGGEGEPLFREALRGVAIDRRGRVYAVGDSMVRVFGDTGASPRAWATARPGFSVGVGEDGRVWVGESQQVEVFDSEGTLLATWRDPGRLGLITAVVPRAEDVFLGDAGARCIHRYDTTGRFLNEVGDRHRKGGFDIPNGVVDFAIDAEGIIHAANPGMHRVERLNADGEVLGHFGRFDGTDPAGFPGCCNPTNIALDPTGRVVVTEKAGPRVKLYDRDGKLLALVADRGFDPGCKNMDVAVDSAGRIYVADPVGLVIRVFEPVAEEP